MNFHEKPLLKKGHHGLNLDDNRLTDGEEVNTHLTDPNDSDSDSDDLSDYEEII